MNNKPYLLFASSPRDLKKFTENSNTVFDSSTGIIIGEKRIREIAAPKNIKNASIDDSKFAELIIDSGNVPFNLAWYTVLPVLFAQILGNEFASQAMGLVQSASAALESQNALKETFATASRFSSLKDGTVVIKVPCLPLVGMINYINELHVRANTSRNTVLDSLLKTNIGSKLVGTEPVEIKIPTNTISSRPEDLDLEKLSGGRYEYADHEAYFGGKAYIKELTLYAPRVKLPQGFDSTEELLEAYKTAPDLIYRIADILRQRLTGAIVCMTATISDEEYRDFSGGSSVTETGFSYLSSRLSRAITDNYGKVKPEEPEIGRIAPFNVVKVRAQNSKVVVKSKQNQDGLSVTSVGRIVWMPTNIDHIDEYEEEVERENISGINGEWCATDVMDPREHGLKTIVDTTGITRHVKKRRGANRLIYLDEAANKLAYTDSNTRINIVDLDAWIPAKATHVDRLSKLRLGTENSNSFLGLLGTVLSNALGTNGQLTVERPLGWYADSEWADVLEQLHNGHLAAVTGECQAAIKSVVENARPLGWKRGDPIPNNMQELVEVAKELEVVTFETLMTAPVFNPIRAALEYLWATAENDLDKLFEHTNPMTVLRGLGIARSLILITKNRPEYDIAITQEKSLLDQPAEDPNRQSNKGVPNVGEGQVILSYQSPAWARLKTGSNRIIIDASAGAGKTSLALATTAYYMSKFGVRKPTIACPAELVKNYFQDGARFFQGRMNFLALTNGTFASWGEEKLREVMESAPPNTIVLTDFFFLRGRSKWLGYGDREFEVSANSELIREWGTDLVIIDEVHKLKNESSSLYKNTIKTFAGTKYIIEMSGTIMPDDLTDVLSIYRPIDPTVFGTKKDFIERFQSEDEVTGRKRWSDDAGAKIKAAMKESAQYVTIKRKAWRAILPPLEENFIISDIQLTPNQRRLYQQILTQALDDYKADLKKSKKINSAIEQNNMTDAEERAAGKLLDRHFARLQRFLSAPELDESAEVLTKPEDRLSPKTKKTYEIIREHLKNRIVGKILVFCQYTRSAESIIANAPEDIAPLMIHYTASRKEECLSELSSDDKMIMVGVESSMNTGLNLQSCFPAQTQVLVGRKKSVSIGELYSNPNVTHVLAYDLRGKEIGKRRILKKMRFDVKETDEYVNVSIRDENSNERSPLLVTSNHMIFLSDGSEVRADSLKPGDKLITYGGDFRAYAEKGINCLIVNAEDLYNVSEKTHSKIEAFINNHFLEVMSVRRCYNQNSIGKYKYDIEVEGDHNYFACAGSHDSHYPLVPVLVHNCSRLIRYEQGWNWGTLEQGMARIWRPVIGKNGETADPRKKVYVDWLAVDKSLDITRMGRLMGKTLDVIKFQENEDVRYQQLKTLPRPSLNPATIAASNSFDVPADKGGLADHLDQYGQMLNLDDISYAEYRADPANNFKTLKLETGEMLPGSAFIKNVPYVPNGAVSYHSSELGLVKYLDYVNSEKAEVSEEDEESDEDVEDSFDPRGLSIHTDQGDGVCIRSSGTTITVELSNNTKYTVKKTVAFVITRSDLSAASIREAIAEKSGARVDSPIVVGAEPDTTKKSGKNKLAPTQVVKPAKETVQEPEQKEDHKDLGPISIWPESFNEWAALEVDMEGAPIEELKAEGFVETPAQFYTEVKRVQQLEAWMAKAEKAFNIPSQYLDSLNHVAKLWHRSRNTLHLMQQVSPAKLRQFLRGQRKPLAKGEIRPHILFTNNKVYLAFDLPRHSAVRTKIKSLTISGFSWKQLPEALTRFCRNIAELRTVFKELTKKFDVDNVKEALGDMASMKTLTSSITPTKK